MRNFEFVAPPPTYSPQMGYNNYGHNTNQYQPPIMMTTPPIMMTTPPIMTTPPVMMVPPQPTAASFIPQTTPGYFSPPMMATPPVMMAPPPAPAPPTAASFIPSYTPVTSPGYGVTPDLVVPFSTNTMVYSGNPYFR